MKKDNNTIKITKLNSNNSIYYPQYLVLCNPNNINDFHFYAVHLDEYLLLLFIYCRIHALLDINHLQIIILKFLQVYIIYLY